MKSSTTGKWYWLFIAAVAVLAVGGVTAQAEWDAMPNHKTYVTTPYFPKAGQGDYVSSGFTPGGVRNVMENYYEGYWRETSYHRADPTNGLPVRGYYMASKTAGEIAMPWAWNAGQTDLSEATVTGAVIDVAVAGITNVYTGTLNPVPIKGRPLTIRIATLFLTDAVGSGQLSGDGNGTVNHSTGAYSFKLSLAAPPGSPIQAFYTYFIQGAAQSAGAWGNYTAVIGDLGASRFPDGRGELFDELADDTPAVLYRRYDPIADVIIDDPLVDGFWTPGERFTDMPGPGGLTAPNGRWDPYIHAEDAWTPIHTNSPLADLVWSLAFSDFFASDERGDFFYDYDFSITMVSTTPPPQVLQFVNPGMATDDALIWVADINRQVNVPVHISEFDLTPPLYYGSEMTVTSTNLLAEDRWVWTATNRVIGSTALEVLDDDIKTFLGEPAVGDVIADYDFSVSVSGTNVGARVNFSPNPIANSNALFYIANVDSGTNVAYRLNELDLTPPQFFINVASGPVTNLPAEDRWEPTHDFSGIAGQIRQLATIRSFLNTEH